MDYMKENEQVWITQVITAFLFFIIVGVLSVLNIFLHADSLLAIGLCCVAAVVAVAGIIQCTKRIGASLRA